MLYERWLEIARSRRHEMALHDLASGKIWTFADLCEAGEHPRARVAEVVFPQGHSPQFVVDVLRAWRWGSIVCPLEPGQAPPAFAPPLPPCAHLKTTSATTGLPRLVAFTAAQLAADAGNIVATMGLRADWPNLGLISLAHSYGFSNLVLTMLLHGIPLVLAPAALPEVLRQALQGRPAVTLPAVPALWRVWVEARVLSPAIRLAISAGAPLPRALEREAHTAFGLKIHNFYGATECGGIAYDRSDTPRAEDAFAGTPVENVLLSVTGQGCLAVRSSAVGQTYWPAPEAALEGGQFQTTDLAELEDGSVYLRGRAADQINLAGRKLAPESVEIVLRRHAAVREAVVFGVPDLDGAKTERLVACVAAQAGTTAEGLRDFLLAQLPAWQVPKEFWFEGALEANPRGKLPRAEWRRRYLEGHRSVALLTSARDTLHRPHTHTPPSGPPAGGVRGDMCAD